MSRETINQYAKLIGRRTRKHPKTLIDRHLPSFIQSRPGKKRKQGKCAVCRQLVRKEKKKIRVSKIKV